ncbi:MAG TPA: hypothetical protein P5205_17905 [Candidatus Paceibacterota bacterium]|nr:hypothetical protein [Verrucomicrobiota bacterium]HSA12239.1 hypothetical protein [Candidatus Paceibacterota bacterium]
MKTRIGDKAGLNTAIGGNELCAWQPVRGVVWVQTRNPVHGRRLAKRSDGRLVVRGVAGGYLRTFEFRGSLAWAAGLMKRYLTDETTANEGLGRAACPRTSRAIRAGRGQRTDVPACCEA